MGIEKSVAQRVRRDDVQWVLIAEAGGQCKRCHETYHPAIYDFHHIDPRNKRFNLDRSNFSRSIESLRVEAGKCVLLCSNCHRSVHAFMDRRFLTFITPDYLELPANE